MTVSSSTSAASSVVAALGGGSGIDMAALASNLATAQFEFRANRLNARSDTLERQISTAGALRSSLAQLSSAMGERLRGGDLAVTPQIANGAVAEVSSPPGATGTGSYSLEVLALAKGQTLASPALPSASAAPGSGTLTIRFGVASGTGFAEDSSQPRLAVDVPGGTSLSGIASAINARGAGLTAYVAQTAQGAQLVIKGREGVQSGFILEATETPGEEGLSALAWNPATGSPPERLLAQAGDAQFKLDGLPMTSASNATGTVAPGVALKLTGTNAGAPTTIGFSSPLTAIGSTMQDLVGALNTIAADLASATDPEGGDLSSDAGARALKRALAGLAGQAVMPNAAQGAPRSLADLGLALQRDGTFRLDTARLDATLARDPAGAAAMFTTGLHGVYATLDKLARTASSSADPGSLAGSIARYQRQAKQLDKDGAKLTEQQEQLRASLVSRFAKADARIGASKSTLSFLQAQIDAWNGQRN